MSDVRVLVREDGHKRADVIHWLGPDRAFAVGRAIPDAERLSFSRPGW